MELGIDFVDETLLEILQPSSLLILGVKFIIGGG